MDIANEMQQIKNAQSLNGHTKITLDEDNDGVRN